MVPGVFLCVLDGLGDHFHADGLPGGPGQTQGDGAGAAVEIQHRVAFCQTGKGPRLFIEDLRLRVVHLIERAGRETEAQAAQLVLDGVSAPEGAEFFAHDGVAGPRIRAQDHGGQARHPIPEQFT